MPTTVADLSRWFDKGVEGDHEFMIVVCDTFSHEDFPVYASKENVHALFDSHNGPNMQRIQEVYALCDEKEAQMTAHTRVNKLPARETKEG